MGYENTKILCCGPGQLLFEYVCVVSVEMKEMYVKTFTSVFFLLLLF